MYEDIVGRVRAHCNDSYFANPMLFGAEFANERATVLVLCSKTAGRAERSSASGALEEMAILLPESTVRSSALISCSRPEANQRLAILIKCM